MNTLFTRLLLVVALLFVSGAHWGGLRSFAWLSMSVDHAQSMPITKAITKALDGSELCQICHFIQNLEEESVPEDPQTMNPRIDLRLQTEAILIFAPAVPQHDLLEMLSPPCITQRPDSPPPGFV